MTENLILVYTGNMMMLTLLLSLPPIIVAAVVGTLVSLIQALTQIQEQTVSFAFKLIAVVLTLLIAAPYLAGEIYIYAVAIFTNFGNIVR